MMCDQDENLRRKQFEPLQKGARDAHWFAVRQILQGGVAILQGAPEIQPPVRVVFSMNSYLWRGRVGGCYHIFYKKE